MTGIEQAIEGVRTLVSWMPFAVLAVVVVVSVVLHMRSKAEAGW